MSTGLHLWLAPLFVFTCQEALRGSSLVKLSTDCQYPYLFSCFYQYKSLVRQKREGKLIGLYLSSSHFVHVKPILLMCPQSRLA